MTLSKYLICTLALTFTAVLAQAQVLGIATNAQGSLYYSVGAAIAGVMQQKAGLTARVQPMSGSSAYAPLVNRGQVEFGLLNVLDVVHAYTGLENFKGRQHQDMRLVGVMFVLPVGMGVPFDSPAKTVKDLKGLRAPSQFTAQSTIQFVQNAALATGGLSTEDMKPFPVSDYVKGMEALGDGKVETALFCLGCGTAQEANVNLSAHGGLRFVEMSDTPEAIAAMHKVFASAYTQVFQPSPAYPGVIGPTRLMVYSAFLVSSKHVPDDVVYKVTKALYENKVALGAASAPMKSFDPKAMAEANTVIYHPGAEKFYREVGEWPPKKR